MNGTFMHQSPKNLDALEVMEPPLAEPESAMENPTSRAWPMALLGGLLVWLFARTGRVTKQYHDEESVESSAPRLWPVALLVGLIIWLFRKTGGANLQYSESPEALEVVEEPSPFEERPVESRTPRLWPIALLLGLVLWVFTTTGGSQIFVNEMLSEAYDSHAEHLLRGDLDVDGNAIRHEVMLVNGHSRMYFGPFPAFVRIPLNWIYPEGRGYWGRITGFCAGMIALAAFTGIVRMGLRKSQLSTRWRYIIGITSLVGFALASPLLLLLGNLSIYGEAIIWGLAWSVAAVYFALRAREAEGPALTRALLGFSLCVAATVFSRATFGAPLVLLAGVLALRLFRRNPIRNFAVLFLPLGLALCAHLYMSYAKFGNFSGMNLNYSINPVQRDFAVKHGIFDVKRIPYSFADYFILRRPVSQSGPPYLRAGRAVYHYPDLFVMEFTETYSSLLWCSTWIVIGGFVGLILILLTKGGTWLDRAMAAVLFMQYVSILCYMGLCQRYVAEFFPLLIFAFAFFLWTGRAAYRMRYLLIAMVVFSVAVNFLSTMAWLIQDDMNVPMETKVKWNKFLGRTH